MTTANPYAAPKANLETPDAGGVDTTSAFSPKGRFPRSTYIAYSFSMLMLVGLIVAMIGGAGAMSGGFSGVGGGVAVVLGVVGYFALIVVGIIFSIRRLHDLNWSGWWVLVTLVPYVNLIITIPLLFFRGTKGVNKYGPPRPAPRSHAVAATLLFGVIFIGGILAAIAIPAYQDYVNRSRMQSQSAPAIEQTGSAQ